MVQAVGKDGSTLHSSSNPLAVTQYDSGGNQINMTPTGAYIASFQIRQTTTTAAASVVFFLRNTHATKIIYVDKLNYELFFDGTGAATIMKYDVAKYTGVTSTNGTAITPAIKRTSYGVSPAAEIKFLDTGITLTGGTLQGIMDVTPCGRVTPSATAWSGDVREYLDFTSARDNYPELALNEALVIRVAATAVIGDNCVGYVSWTER